MLICVKLQVLHSVHNRFIIRFQSHISYLEILLAVPGRVGRPCLQPGVCAVWGLFIIFSRCIFFPPPNQSLPCCTRITPELKGRFFVSVILQARNENIFLFLQLLKYFKNIYTNNSLIYPSWWFIKFGILNYLLQPYTFTIALTVL